jgi:hypothetical protein
VPELDAPRSRTRRFLGRIGDPVVVIFVLAGVFDLLSGDFLVHGLVLLAVAGGLVWDAARGRPREGAPPVGEPPTERPMPRRDAASVTSARRRISWTAFAVPALAYAVIVGAFARYSWPASIAVLIPAAAAIAIAWRTPSRGVSTTVGGRSASAWAVVFVALALWELAALLLQPSLTADSYAHPTISVLMDSVLASSIGRSAFLAVWLGVGRVLLDR